MEFPDLGKHCAKGTCNQLDFLPMKCDACEEIFCLDHFTYDGHECPSGYKKNMQVPVCPLCNSPVPITRGTLPDIAVSQHIDNLCQSDPAKAKRIYSNKCSLQGCKKKEMVPVTCDKCRQNFCLKHRLEVDHKCQGFIKSGKAISNSGFAAYFRQQKPAHAEGDSGSGNSSSGPFALRNAQPRQAQHAVSAVQGNMTEDEALAKALQNSLSPSKNVESQEDHDRRMAEELQRQEYTEGRPRARENNRTCRVA